MILLDILHYEVREQDATRSTRMRIRWAPMTNAYALGFSRVSRHKAPSGAGRRMTGFIGQKSDAEDFVRLCALLRINVHLCATLAKFDHCCATLSDFEHSSALLIDFVHLCAGRP